MTTTTRPVGFKERLFGAWIVRRMEPGTAVWYFRRDRIALLSFIFLTLVILAAIFAPLLTPYPEQGLGVPNITEKFQAPSITHPMGTDGLGRDGR